MPSTITTWERRLLFALSIIALYFGLYYLDIGLSRGWDVHIFGQNSVVFRFWTCFILTLIFIFREAYVHELSALRQHHSRLPESLFDRYFNQRATLSGSLLNIVLGLVLIEYCLARSDIYIFGKNQDVHLWLLLLLSALHWYREIFEPRT